MIQHKNAICRVFLALALLQGCWLYSQSKEIILDIFKQGKVGITLKNGMPIPSEDKFIKIEVAGLGTSVDKSNPSKRVVFWMFGFTQKSGPKISRVEVEELFPDKPERLVITDGDPDITGNRWSSHTEATPIDATTTPWLYSNRTSSFLFRFTIQFENGEQRVLHQLSMFPGEAKALLIQPAAPQ